MNFPQRRPWLSPLLVLAAVAGCDVNSGTDAARGDEAAIVGGKDISITDAPWQVALTKPDSIAPFCGGSIVNERWIDLLQKNWLSRA